MFLFTVIETFSRESDIRILNMKSVADVNFDSACSLVDELLKARDKQMVARIDHWLQRTYVEINEHLRHVFCDNLPLSAMQHMSQELEFKQCISRQAQQWHDVAFDVAVARRRELNRDLVCELEEVALRYPTALVSLDGYLQKQLDVFMRFIRDERDDRDEIVFDIQLALEYRDQFSLKRLHEIAECLKQS